MKIEKIGGEVVLPSGEVAPLAKAIKSNDKIYLSGQLAFEQNGKLCTGNIIDQTKVIFNNIDSLLTEAGSNKNKILKVTAWLTNKNDYSDFNKVYTEYFGSYFPARSVLGANLMIDGALVEIEVTAVI